MDDAKHNHKTLILSLKVETGAIYLYHQRASDNARKNEFPRFLSDHVTDDPGMCGQDDYIPSSERSCSIVHPCTLVPGCVELRSEQG